VRLGGLRTVDPVEPVGEVAAAVRVLGSSRGNDEERENPCVDGRGFQNQVLLREIRRPWIQCISRLMVTNIYDSIRLVESVSTGPSPLTGCALAR
jgi:hypothetical protein